MSNKFNQIIIIFILTYIFIGCSKSKPNPKTKPVVSDIMSMENALSDDDVKFVNLLNKVRGSVGRLGPGSKVIWSRKNDYSLGIYISANHVYNISNWNSRQESFIDILNENNGIFLGSHIPPSNGTIAFDNEFIADYGLYHPEIPLLATNYTILPKHDFYVGILDNQRAIDNGLAVYPGIVQINHDLEMFDPKNRTTASQTWAKVSSGNNIIVVGYPQDQINYPNGAVSKGLVLSDLEAQLTIEQLLQAGDEEGKIPYDNSVEFLSNAKAVKGMSGGGVFNSEGQLIGISVRATTLNNKNILRVVKINYIRNQLKTFYNNLSSSEKDKLRQFISGEL